MSNKPHEGVVHQAILSASRSSSIPGTVKRGPEGQPKRELDLAAGMEVWNTLLGLLPSQIWVGLAVLL